MKSRLHGPWARFGGMAPQPRDAPRALVVDDEREPARLIADYLTRDGFVAETAFDGPSEVAAARANPPDLVVYRAGFLRDS